MVLPLALALEAQKFFGLYRHGEFQKDNGAVKLTEQKKEPKTVVSDTFNP